MATIGRSKPENGIPMSSRRYFAACALLIFAVSAPSPVIAQTTAGQITGIVNDPSGAAVPDASVTAVNSATGSTRKTTSNQLGNYTVPLLEPGTYTVKVEKQGFRPIGRPGVTLHVNQVARIDFIMELGSLTESVSVTAESPFLQTAEASLGAVVDNAKIVNLPLNGRNPFDLVFLAPGALMYNRRDLPGNNIPLANLSINGGPSMGNEVLLDGIPDTSPQYNQFAIIPSIDSVQEFKVQTNNMSAEFGRTSGGVINVSMKSGTNQVHGTVYEFLRNNVLDSNNWFNNATGRTTPPFRYNQFGATVGGVLRKDKTFYFASYEGMRRHTGSTLLFSVPTPEQREGDFRQTRAQNGQLIQIFDPMTSRLLPSGAYQRDQFPGNVIPANRVNSISRNMLAYWPKSNLPGDSVTGINNFISNAGENYTIDQVNARIDHAFTDTNRLFGRISWNASVVTPPNIYDNVANPNNERQLFTQRNVALNDTHAFTAHTFATFRLGFTRLRDSSDPVSLGFDPTQLGFPDYMRGAAPVLGFPWIQVTGYTPPGITSTLGIQSQINNISNALTGQSDVTHIRGSHVLKVGGEYRLFRMHGNRPNFPLFQFNQAYTQGPDPTRGSATAGQAIASFLLGTPSGGNVQDRPTQDSQTQYLGAFVQDDYRITSALTLNFGLRFDRENLRTDRYDRLSFLDFDSPSPLKAPGLAPLRGGLQYAGVGGNPREQAKVAQNFCPRFGFAWQWRPETVVRGGYGIFIAPRTGWDFGNFGQTGYLATTTFVSSVDGITPVNLLNNPYPNGFVAPTGNSLGLMTNAGAAISSIDRGQQGIYIQQWNFGVQRSLAGNLIEVAYAGSKGTNLIQSLEYNQLPDQYLTLGNELIRRIPNPFFGLVPANQPLGASTTTAGQLLRPYPQFTGFSAIGATSGSSIYHSAQIRVEKRLTRGLTYLVSYTVAKLIDDGSPGRNAAFGPTPIFQNNNNRQLERSLSSQEVPQRLSIASSYELPFGPGRAFAAGVPSIAARLISGWQINAIASFQSGIPLSLVTSVNNTNSLGGGSRPNNNGTSAKLSGPTVDRLNRYFDTSAFSLPAPYTFGNVSRTLPDVRAPGQVNFDFSLLKNTKITERTALQFRAEAFNALNNTNFGVPGQSIGSPTAGVISTAGAARIVQLGLKFLF